MLNDIAQDSDSHYFFLMVEHRGYTAQIADIFRPELKKAYIAACYWEQQKSSFEVSCASIGAEVMRLDNLRIFTELSINSLRLYVPYNYLFFLSYSGCSDQMHKNFFKLWCDKYERMMRVCTAPQGSAAERFKNGRLYRCWYYSGWLLFEHPTFVFRNVG
jgi:hypothetical protein